MNKKYFFIILSICLFSSNIIAQDKTSNQALKDIVKVNGSLGATSTLYQAYGIEARRDPFYYMFNASLNLNIFGISVPFSATYSQQNKSYTQPFNQYGLSPKYKSVTAHIGYRNMQLTDFSFSSTTFYGLGVEVSPENSLIKGAAFYGRLLKATPSVINGIPNPIGFSNPIFARKGFGGKVDIGTSKNAVTLAFFKASDDITSLLNDSTTAFVKPAENAVIGISTIQKLGKKIDCKGEIDYSAYNRNTRISEGQYPGFNYLNNMEPIFSANSATQFNRAIKASLNYKVKLYKIGLKYRRIDPDYQSMGAVYINNDFEDITANTTIKLLKSKLNFGGSGGLQRNNLLSDRAVSVIRLIGSLNANYNPNDHWAFSGAYSNFNSSSTQTLITGLDTVLFAQITKNANANVSFNNNNREKKLTIFCAGNYQIARVAKDSTVFYNVNLGAQYVITRLKAGITASMNLNQNIAALNNSAAYGPSIVFTKGIRKNIKINASFSYLTSLLEQEKSGQFINTRINVSYRYKKHHSLSSSISFIDKSLIVDDINSNEFIGMINYNYSF